VSLQSVKSEAPSCDEDYVLDWLPEEVSSSISGTAAGGNASLLAVA
jgi:delta 1-pyrroline-5-carboxylate dehydrogenase